MGNAEKMAGLLVMLVIGISFLNRGKLEVGSGPSGAYGNLGYYGYVK